MRTKNNSGKNRWKVGFFLLLFFNLAFFTLAYYAIQPSDEQSEINNSTRQTVSRGEMLAAEITLSEHDLEDFLQFFLSGEGKEATPVIHFDKDVSLTGELSILGMSVQYLMMAEPFSVESGDMQLKVREIQLGVLNLPIEQSLQLMARQFTSALPIRVDAANKLVHVLLTEIQTDQLEGLRLIRIDKETQEYVFETTIVKRNLLQ